MNKLLFPVLGCIVILVVISCQPINEPEIVEFADDKDTTVIRYLAMGDSYTIGESVDSSQRWPVQLVDTLRRSGNLVEDPLIIARTGWTTDELAAGINRANPDSNFGLVSLLIGVNNQYRGRSVDQYRLELRDLLSQAIAFAGNNPNRVFVLSIPDWGVTPFASGFNRAQIAKEIDEFNSVKREESILSGVTYINITDISRRAMIDPSLVAPDGLHPSGKMYREWVFRSLPEIERILKLSIKS